MVGCLNKANRLIARILICLLFLVAKSAYCQTETLTGTISLPVSMTSNDSEHKLKIDITEWDKDNVKVTKSTKLVDILPGSTSVNYQIYYPQPHKNSKVGLVIHCYRGCGPLDGLSGRYVLQDDGSFSNDDGLSSNKSALVPPELLLSEKNLQLPESPPSKTLKGTISLPASMSRNENDIEVNIGITVSSSNYNGHFNSHHSENVTIKPGKTSVDYEIDYYLPSPNHSIQLSFYCGSNCSFVNPRRKRFQLLNDGSLNDNPYSEIVERRVPASAFPKRLDFQIPKTTINKTLTGTFSLPDSIPVPKGGINISVAIEVLDKDGEPVDFRRTTNLRVPHGSTKINYELDYYLSKGSSQARLSFLCMWCNGFGNFNYLQKDGSYSQDHNSDPIPIEEFPEKVDYQYDGQEQYSLLARFWWWVLSLGRSNSKHVDTTSEDTSDIQNIADSSDNAEGRSAHSAQKNGELIVSLLKEWNWRVNYDKSTQQRHDDIRTYYSTTFEPKVNELLIQRARVAKWATPLKKVETNKSLYTINTNDIDGWTLSYTDVSESNKQRLLILAFGCKKALKCVVDVWTSKTEFHNSEGSDIGSVASASLMLVTDYDNYETTKELIDQISYPFFSPSDFEEKYGTDIKGARAELNK